MAGQQPVAAFGRERLEPPDRGDRVLGLGVDEAPDRKLLVDVALEIGRVEGEHEPAPVVEIDHEGLVPGRVPVGRDRGDAGRDLEVTVGEPPVDRGIVEVECGTSRSAPDEDGPTSPNSSSRRWQWIGTLPVKYFTPPA